MAEKSTFAATFLYINQSISSQAPTINAIKANVITMISHGLRCHKSFSLSKSFFASIFIASKASLFSLNHLLYKKMANGT